MRENEPTVISEANQQTTVLSISDNVDTKISPAADFRCFEQRFMSWIVAENSYYESYTYIEKEHDQYCDPLNYVYGFEYRMIDVNQVTRWHDEGGYTGIYSEYLFLDDSRIKLGEKEIKTYS